MYTPEDKDSVACYLEEMIVNTPRLTLDEREALRIAAEMLSEEINNERQAT